MHNVSCETFDLFVCIDMFHVKLELNKNQCKNVPRETISDYVEVIFL